MRCGEITAELIGHAQIPLSVLSCDYMQGLDRRISISSNTFSSRGAEHTSIGIRCAEAAKVELTLMGKGMR
jgi:hypothetical protein